MSVKTQVQVEINKDWCKSCGICASFCPKNVLSFVKGVIEITNSDNCIGCGKCEQLCPDFAISLRGKENE